MQYQLLTHFAPSHEFDNMDHAMANVGGAAAACISAFALAKFVEFFKQRYYDEILQRHGGETDHQGRCRDKCLYGIMACCVNFSGFLRLGRTSDLVKVRMQKKLEAINDEKKLDAQWGRKRKLKDRIVLDKNEEMAFVESLVGAQTLNLWAMLMPAVYQLVPGAMVARMWFNSLFPPLLEVSKDAANTTRLVNGTNVTVSNTTKTYVRDGDHAGTFSNLMVISTSLAVGLILGFALVNLLVYLWNTFRGLIRWLVCCGDDDPVAGKGNRAMQNKKKEKTKAQERGQERLLGMFTAAIDDPRETRVKREPSSIRDSAIGGCCRRSTKKRPVLGKDGVKETGVARRRREHAERQAAGGVKKKKRTVKDDDAVNLSLSPWHQEDEENV